MLQKFTRSELIIGVAALVLLIASFLPWFSASVGPISVEANGWDVGFLWGGLPVILGLIMLAHVALTRLSPDTKVPALPVGWGQIHLGAGALAALLVVLKLIIGEDSDGAALVGVDIDRSFGLFLATLAALALAYGGFLYFQEHKGETTIAEPGASPA